MFRKLMVAGVFLGSLTAPAFAEDFYVLRSAAGVSTESQSMPCFAAPRMAEAGEEKIGGPYPTQAKAEEEMKNLAGCTAFEQDG